MPYHARGLFSAAVTLLLACWSLASTASASDNIKHWRGFLIDRQCQAAVKDDPDPEDFVAAHGKSCLLMPACRKVGYVLYSGKKWWKLDEKGNQLAIKLIRASRRDSGFLVRIDGSAGASQDVIKVSKISEVEDKNKTGAASEGGTSRKGER